MQEEVHKELWNRDKRIFTQAKEAIESNGQKLPDPKLHQIISFIKSGIRIIACAAGIAGWYGVGFIGLLIAEVVGIGEELV